MLYSIDNLAVQMVKKWDDSGEMAFVTSRGIHPQEIGVYHPQLREECPGNDFFAPK